MSAPISEDRRPLRCDICGEIYPYDQLGSCLVSRRIADATLAFCGGPLVPCDRRQYPEKHAERIADAAIMAWQRRGALEDATEIIAAALARERGFTAKDMREAQTNAFVLGALEGSTFDRNKADEEWIRAWAQKDALRRWPDGEGA